LNPKPNTPPATTKTPFQRFVDRLVKRIETEGEPQHPGVIMNYEARGVDDGAGYSDPMIDDRPEWLKREDEGWTVLK
jgi:hypothetical protein